jgi:hypothetical protein
MRGVFLWSAETFAESLLHWLFAPSGVASMPAPALIWLRVWHESCTQRSGKAVQNRMENASDAPD